MGIAPHIYISILIYINPFLNVFPAVCPTLDFVIQSALDTLMTRYFHPNLKFEEIEGTQTISQTVEPHSRTDLSNGSETGSQIYHKVEVALDILTD